MQETSSAEEDCPINNLIHEIDEKLQALTMSLFFFQNVCLL